MKREWSEKHQDLALLLVLAALIFGESVIELTLRSIGI